MKIASPFNNICSVERYAKKVTLENVHCLNEKVWTPYKIFSEKKKKLKIMNSFHHLPFIFILKMLLEVVLML
jgi:hypothetical protein